MGWGFKVYITADVRQARFNDFSGLEVSWAYRSLLHLCSTLIGYIMETDPNL